MAAYRHVTHTFGPVYDRESVLLILGSFPSVKSLDKNFYYANPRNRFWDVLQASVSACGGHAGSKTARGDGTDSNGNTSGRGTSDRGALANATIDRKKHMLHCTHIALWDVIESCDIKGSSDASITNVHPVDIARITSVAAITSVITNGGTARKLYTKYLYPRTHIPNIALPSTSPANASWSYDRLVSVWKPAIVHALA